MHAKWHLTQTYTHTVLFCDDAHYAQPTVDRLCVCVSAQFDNPLYYNSCTMKSCCFAGSRDQYVLSGSDDFSLYMWKVPDDPGTTGVARESWGPSLGLEKKVPNPKYLVNLLLLECFSPENIPGLVRLDGLPSPAYGSNYCKY